MNSRWIVRTKAHPSLRLFCFPYAGGGASVFRQWGQKLPLEIEACPVYLPGRESRLNEPLYTELDPLVTALSEALQPHLDIPYAFFGHSLGGLLAFELARHLQAQQQIGPQHLFVSAHRAPQLPLKRTPIRALPDAEFRKALFKIGGTPAAVLAHEELMELLTPIIRADFTIYETYRYRPGAPLTCPLTAFGGTQDHLVSRAELEPWREQTSNTFTLTMLNGEHFFVQSAQDDIIRLIVQSM